MFDVVKFGAQRGGGYCQRRRNRIVEATHLGDVGQTVLDQFRERGPFLEGEENLLVEVGLRVPRDGDVLQLVGRHARTGQDRLDGQRWEARAVLSAIEALLL